MLNLSYLDMCHLLDVVKKDSSSRTDSIIASVQSELNRTPHQMVAACLSPLSRPDHRQDIFFLNTEGLIQFLRQKLNDPNYSDARVIVLTDVPEVAEELMYKLIRYVDSGKVDPMKTGRLVCTNGMQITVISRKSSERMRGTRYTLGIIHTL